MRSIVPTQKIELAQQTFPVTGKQREIICNVVAMELYGCELAEVAKELGMTPDEVLDITTSSDYAYVKSSMINSIRRMDSQTLAGRVNQEASEAFERMRDLADNAKREDVKFNANKDLLDRAMLNGIANSGQTDELRITIIKRR